SVSGVCGPTRTAIVVALGTSWRSNSNRFAPNTALRKLTPVTLPPGRLRLATRPSLTGAAPVAKTTGTVVGGGLAARAALWVATITATRRLIQSAAQTRRPARG